MDDTPELGRSNKDPLTVYEEMIAPESMTAFGRRIDEGPSSEDVTAERLTVLGEQDKLSAQISDIYADLSLDQAEVEARVLNIVKQARVLDERLEYLNELRPFLEWRCSAFNSEHAKAIVYDAGDAAVQDLLASVKEFASTSVDWFQRSEEFNSMLNISLPPIEVVASKTPIQLPVAAFVSALGLASWADGRVTDLSGIREGFEDKKDGLDSRQVIQDYASRDTDIPPLDWAVASISPDGMVFFASHSAHRMAAAKLKGQETILVKGLSVYVQTE